ncbi:uncharacterized protein EV422DRAFT_480066, partial [Fimicolochytrium jonesii]|uniref:uncharacterized protein n=1 Tax=Fimicolochytrium jonesii TaxID=1396493 RepID=UPI0022FDCACF
MVGNPGDYVFGQRGLDDIVSQLMEQTQQRNAPPPAAPSTIASLPKITITEKDLGANPTSTSNSYNANSENTDKVYTRDCPICQDDFNVGDEAVRLPCKHVFHEGCVGSWLGVNGTCPVCRYSLV